MTSHLAARVAISWLLISLTAALRFSSIQIPALVQRGASFWLACQFHLDPRFDRLYSVKWYRNEEEFYRLLWAGSQALGPGEQQHFGQPGVNVMMSSSNATHVRLLNASMESEGIYACEISTQNLSTIRYDREIKVYVLPQSKPTIIGFKTRYSLAEQVDLSCLSDFSRPQPALSWFINGHRIHRNSKWFQVDLEPMENKVDHLYALKLRLRFKLTGKLIDSVVASSDASFYRKDGKQTTSIRLECKYRLTDVVDVVFNELEVSLDTSGSPMVTQSSWLEAPVRLMKSRNQLSQSIAPTSAMQLAKALQEQIGNQCSSSWLNGDDPLLVEVDKNPSAGGNISLNCSTALSFHSSLVSCPLDKDTSSQRQRQFISGQLQAWPQANQRPHVPKLAPNKPSYLWLQKSPSNPGLGRVSLQELGLDSAESAPEPQTPPFLEWFINNQEAPNSSVQYHPPLPVRPTISPITTNWPQVAASMVDYTYYFANFESRSRQQHLELQLDLQKERENLKISDSKLTLRCSSTQAQLLLTDTTSVTIVVGYWAEFSGSSKGHQSASWQTNTKQLGGSLQQAKRQGSSSAHTTPTKLSWTLSISWILVLLLIQQTNQHI